MTTACSQLTWATPSKGVDRPCSPRAAFCHWASVGSTLPWASQYCLAWNQLMPTMGWFSRL